jgi:fucose 4-O-acetylase-like acetyltransferase
VTSDSPIAGAQRDSVPPDTRSGGGATPWLIRQDEQHPPVKVRELYIDAFRGLMALAMVQGHLMDHLLTESALVQPWYIFQQMFHGTTAPGFLFASGFVAGLPRAPLSARASFRRARRLLFVFGIGYFIHLPYFSLWKTAAAASPLERAQLFACDALQVIAATQLFVMALQWVFGRHWTSVAAALAVVVIALTPGVWSADVSTGLPEWLAPYLDQRTGSHFPVFPFSAFVLAGTLAGAKLGRVEPRLRHRREVVVGLGFLAAGLVLARLLEGRVDFWGPSPAYVLLRLGGLLLLLLGVEAAARAELAGMRALALLGHETLQVYVFHLYMLFGGLVVPSPLVALRGRLGFGAASLILLLMLPVLLAAAWAWRAVKQRFPHQAQLALAFLVVTLVYEFLTRPW